MGKQFKRRVCCFCETWESGGIESFLYNVLSQMDFTQLEVDLVASEVRDSVFTTGLQKHGVCFHELSGDQHNFFKNWLTFQKLLRERRYDVIHFNVFQGLSLFYAHLAKRYEIPVRIVHSHNTALRRSRTRWLKARIHGLAKNLFAGAATERLACSAAAAAFMFPKRILDRSGFRYIPNGIETERFRFSAQQREEVRKTLGLSHAFVIGHVGRLCEQKNQMFLLDIFLEVWQRRPESRLLLIGTGEMEVPLRKRVDELGIAGQVIFGGVSDQIQGLLWAMDAFVFPSLFEGLGIAAVEAQAAGLPVFCSEHIPEEAHVTPQFHKLHLNDPPLQWAEVILPVSVPETERGAGADQVRRAGFDIGDVAQKIEAIYWERAR